jgi:GTP-binding protein
MIIKSAQYHCSSISINQCPKPVLPEHAFIGRSNVGKSSLINMILNRKRIAKTSRTPGKTQLINHFLVNNEWYLVDLPGYGFTKGTFAYKGYCNKIIKEYIIKRENLLCLFVLIDSRHSPLKNDIKFMEFLGNNQIPFVIVFTKVDKLSVNEFNRNLLNYKKEMLRFWEALPRIFTTSATRRSGREALLNFIEETNQYMKS